MGPFEKYPPSPRMGIGPLQIDLARGTVSGLGGAGGLTSRAEHLLLLLARYPNLLVTREEILETVWAGRVVEDAAITNCIWQIRKALGERGKEILQTRAKRGYVLVVGDGDWILDVAPPVPGGLDMSDDAVVRNPVSGHATTDQSAADEALTADATLADAAFAEATPADSTLVESVSANSARDALSTAAPSTASRWSLRIVIAILVAAIICGGIAWRFLRGGAEPIVLRTDVEMTMTVVLPDRLDWVRAALLRSVIEHVYLHGGKVVLFQKMQTRNPFAGPHLQVQVSRAANNDIDAELTLSQGRTVVRERFHGAANQLMPAVQAMLSRTFGAPIRPPTRAVDALVSGWVAEQQFDHSRAITEFRRAIARDPALDDAKIALASALLEQGQGNAALALIDPLLAKPGLDANQRCALDEMLTDVAPERLQKQLCDRAARTLRIAELEMRELLREIEAQQAPKGAQQWLHDEHAAVFAHIRLVEIDEAEARLVRAQTVADEAGWEHARIMLGTLRSVAANHKGQSERSVRLQLESADALEALGDTRGALRERMIGLRRMPVVPGSGIAARRAELRMLVDNARAMGSVRDEIDALHLLVRLDRGRPDVWRVELVRILELIEYAYPSTQPPQDLHMVLNEMQVQHRYSEVLDGVARIERSRATQPRAQMWILTLRAESHFARDELDQAVAAVDAMARENFELLDTNPCLYAWLFTEARRPQRARELIRLCRSRQYDRAKLASYADLALVAEARLRQLEGEAERVWPLLRPRIETLIGTPDITLREAESLALLARHAASVPGADQGLLQQALAIGEALAQRDGSGLKLKTGVHVLRWRLCTVADGDCGPVLPPWAPEDRLEQRLALQAAGR